MPRINPFQPNSPVAPGMFAGRIAHLHSLEEALRQTRGERPKHFLITTQAKRNLSSRSGIGGVLSAT